MANFFQGFKRPQRSRAAVFLTTSGLLALAGAATAQDATPPAAPQTASSTDPVVVIVAAPRQEIKARKVQQDAPNLISVQSAETIAKYPDFNAAEALGRMPGISLSSDTGEGRFVQIRGIDANLNGATYGGVPLLNTNPGGTAASSSGRAVEYDTIPTGAINGIVVTYTGMPDHDAEGLGGSIELSPRTAADITKPFADVTVGDGYEPLHDHTGPVTGELAFGGRFGFDSKGLVVQDDNTHTGAGAGANPTPFSFVITLSHKEDRRAIDDIEEDYVDDGMAPSNAVADYSLRRYNYHRIRFGEGGEFDYKPNEDHLYYIRADVAGYTESVNKNILDYDNLNDVEGPTGQIPANPSDPNGFLVTTQPVIQSTDEREKHTNKIYVIGGRDHFGDWTIDYHAAHSEALFTEDHDIVAKFNGPDNIPFTYDDVANADYPIFGFPNGEAQINDPTQYKLKSIKNEQDYDSDKENAYAINALLKAKLFTEDDTFKFGTEIRLRDKSASEYDESYSVPSLSLAAVSSPAINYYNGVFTNGPQVNIPAVANLVYSGAAPVQDGGPVFNPSSYFTAKEDIYAAYAEYMGRVGKWGFLAGVRLEQTDATYGGYIQPTNPDGSSGANVFETRTNNYLNPFPTVQVRYDFDPSMTLRATYSTGIGRPGFLQNSTSATVDFSQGTVAVITRGNPDLKPTLGNNFDLSLEKYLPYGGIIQVGVFDKEFTNYIAPRIENGVMDPLAPGQLSNVTTYLNIPNGYARGVDASYHQKFVWLPKPFDGFGVEANITLVSSRFLEYNAATSGTGQNEYGMLPGTSADTWNFALFYEAHGFQMRLSAEYISHSLFGLGGDKSLDNIQDNRQLLDFSTSYRINPTWSVYFNAKNLNNDPLRYYEGSPDRPLQREFYDATYEAGLRANF